MNSAAKKKIILIVGPETLLAPPPPNSPLAQDWEIRATPDIHAALETLRHTPIHAIVADVKLPETTGPRFLNAVAEQFPDVHRFLLADIADTETMRKCAGVIHPLLAKPCTPASLLAAITRATAIDTLFASEAIKKLAGAIKRVPSPPSSYFQIIRELQSPNATMDSIAELISQDPAVTGKLLQLVNSVSYGLQHQISNLGEAILFLGMESTKSLVLLAHTFSYFDDAKLINFKVEALWAHSLSTARLARVIAQRELAPTVVRDEAFTAGLLHDIGKLLLAMNGPEQFKQARDLAIARNEPEWRAEQEVFGATHAELGAWIIGIWGLSLNIVEAILLHHTPARLLNQNFCPLTAVHVADVLWHHQRGAALEPGLHNFDEGYLATLNLQDRIETWNQLERMDG
jgi:putative nucleotidyltransferase with HDIG domain